MSSSSAWRYWWLWHHNSLWCLYLVALIRNPLSTGRTHHHLQYGDSAVCTVQWFCSRFLGQAGLSLHENTGTMVTAQSYCLHMLFMDFSLSVSMTHYIAHCSKEDFNTWLWKSLYIKRVKPLFTEHGLFHRLNDLVNSCHELDSWTRDFVLPAVVWLSGLFNPQSFLTGESEFHHIFTSSNRNINAEIFCMLSFFSFSFFFLQLCCRV